MSKPNFLPPILGTHLGTSKLILLTPLISVLRPSIKKLIGALINLRIPLNKFLNHLPTPVNAFLIAFHAPLKMFPNHSETLVNGALILFHILRIVFETVLLSELTPILKPCTVQIPLFFISFDGE